MTSPLLRPSERLDRLRLHERYAAAAILDRPNADPDDDAAIVARAALRLDQILRSSAEASVPRPIPLDLP